jgi:hypothetical protein
VADLAKRSFLLPHEITLQRGIPPHLPSLRSSLPSADADRELFSTYTTLQDDYVRTDIRSPMEDNDGTLTMFSTPLRTDNPHYDNIVIENESQQNSYVVATLIPPSQSLERDGNLLLSDLVSIHQDSVDRNMSESSTLFHEIDNLEQVVANMENRQIHCHSVTHSPAAHQSHTTERASTEEASIPKETPEPASIASHYLRSYEVLTSKYGENASHNLKPV